MLCGVALPFARPAKSVETPAKSKPLSSTIRVAITEYIAGFVHGARSTTSFALLPLYTIHIGSDPGRSLQFLTAICVGSLIFQPVSVRVIDRCSPRAVLHACAFLQVVSC